MEEFLKIQTTHLTSITVCHRMYSASSSGIKKRRGIDLSRFRTFQDVIKVIFKKKRKEECLFTLGSKYRHK